MTKRVWGAGRGGRQGAEEALVPPLELGVFESRRSLSSGRFWAVFAEGQNAPTVTLEVTVSIKAMALGTHQQ